MIEWLRTEQIAIDHVRERHKDDGRVSISVDLDRLAALVAIAKAAETWRESSPKYSSPLTIALNEANLVIALQEARSIT